MAAKAMEAGHELMLLEWLSLDLKFWASGQRSSPGTCSLFVLQNGGTCGWLDLYLVPDLRKI